MKSYINEGVPNIDKFHICWPWLFLISRHNEIMLKSREDFAGTVLYFYYHICTLLKHNLFFEPWEAFVERLMGRGVVRQNASQFVSHAKCYDIWSHFFDLKHEILVKFMKDRLFRGVMKIWFAVTLAVLGLLFTHTWTTKQHKPWNASFER